MKNSMKTTENQNQTIQQPPKEKEQDQEKITKLIDVSSKIIDKWTEFAQIMLPFDDFIKELKAIIDGEVKYEPANFFAKNPSLLSFATAPQFKAFKYQSFAFCKMLDLKNAYLKLVEEETDEKDSEKAEKAEKVDEKKIMTMDQFVKFKEFLRAHNKSTTRSKVSEVLRKVRYEWDDLEKILSLVPFHFFLIQVLTTHLHDCRRLREMPRNCFFFEKSCKEGIFRRLCGNIEFAYHLLSLINHKI